jgi:hypothetical protein
MAEPDFSATMVIWILLQEIDESRVKATCGSAMVD